MAASLMRATTRACSSEKPLPRKVSSCSAKFTYLYELSARIILAVWLQTYIYVCDRIRSYITRHFKCIFV